MKLPTICMLVVLHVVRAVEIQKLLDTTDRILNKVLNEDTDVSSLGHVAMTVRRSLGLEPPLHTIRKRQPEDTLSQVFRKDSGTFHLKGVEEISTLPVIFPKDIQLVEIGESVYGLTLESESPSNPTADYLVVYQTSVTNGVREVLRVRVVGVTKLALTTIEDVLYIILLERKEATVRFGSAVSRLRVVREGYEDLLVLEQVQRLRIMEPTSAEFWTYMDETYLAIAAVKSTTVYKWLGKHFDRIQELPMQATCIAPFNMGSFMFLAVGSQTGNDGQVEILKFRLQDDKFVTYQKIPTSRSLDVKHFTLSQQGGEHFLVVTTTRGSTTSSESIIYKYDNDLFTPFQAIHLSDAYFWVPLLGAGNEFVLLVATYRGITGFQYNGWRFIEIPMQYREGSFGSGVLSLKPFLRQRQTWISVANKNSHGQHPNVFRVAFEKQYDMATEHYALMSWCEDTMTDLSRDSLGVLMEPSEGDILKEVAMQEGDVVRVLTKAVQDYTADNIEELNVLSKRTDTLRAILSQTADVIRSMAEQAVTFRGPVLMDSLTLSCLPACDFPAIVAETINTQPMDELLQQVQHLDSGTTCPTLNHFDEIKVRGELNAEQVNGHPPETMMDVNEDTLLAWEIHVNGTVTFLSEVDVFGRLDGVAIDPSRVLLARGDQNFTGPLHLVNVSTERLAMAGRINGVQITSLEDDPQVPNMNASDHMGVLNVREMTVHGLVSGVNFTATTLPGYFTDMKNVSFAEVTVPNVEITSGALSAIPLNTLVHTTEDNHLLGNITFTQPVLSIKSLVVNGTVNGLSVPNLTDLEDAFSEEVNGRSEDLAHFTNLTMATVIVNGTASVRDVRSRSQPQRSLKGLLRRGVKLTSPVIDQALRFNRLNASNVDVVALNDVAASSLVSNATSSPVSVSGRKHFADNIHIEGDVHVRIINSMVLGELQQDAMRLKGDQVVTRNITFKEIVCPRIVADSIHFGASDWSNLKTTIPENVTVIGSVTVRNLTVENLTLDGELNGVHWDAMIGDSVTRHADNKSHVSGDTFVDADLQVHGRFNDEWKEGEDEEIPLSEIVVGDLILENGLTVQELTVEGSVDEVSVDEFASGWLSSNVAQTIDTQVVFEDLDLPAGCHVANETINNINLRYLFINAARIDQSEHFDSLTLFDDVTIADNSTVALVNGGPWNYNVVKKNSDVAQSLTASILFQDLEISGDLRVDGLVAGVNLTRLCDQANIPFNLVVGGSLHFDKEPLVLDTVNNVEIEALKSEVWLRDTATIVTGTAVFQSVTALDEVNVGTLNGMNLHDMSKTYLSRRRGRHQQMVAPVHVSHLVVEKQAFARNVTVKGFINSHKLEELTKEMLIQGEDQIIEGEFSFQTLRVTNLMADKGINGLNLSGDVLRYDVPNALVKGSKTFLNLQVVNLTLPDGLTVQGVDVSAWDKLAVRTVGNYVISDGIQLQDGIFTNQLKVQGSVNNLHFDSRHLMTVNGNQIVTAEKVFYSNHTLTMSEVTIDGQVNGVNITEMMEGGARRGSDLLLAGNRRFLNDLTASRVQLEDTFNEVNVSDMCYQILHHGNINRFENEYKLMEKQAKDVEAVFKRPAYFLNYFESVQKIKGNVTWMEPYTSPQHVTSLLSVFRNTGEGSTMELLEWDPMLQSFQATGSGDLEIKDPVTLVASGRPNAQSGDLLLFETRASNASTSVVLLQSSGLSRLETHADTTCATLFGLRALNKTCLLLGRRFNNASILCEDSISSGMRLYQTLDVSNVVQASAFAKDDMLYVAVVSVAGVDAVVSVLRFNSDVGHFTTLHSLPVVNPVSTSLVYYDHIWYLAVASGRVPESVHTGFVTVFRLNNNDTFFRYQDIAVNSPGEIRFSVLPTEELLLYVLTSRPGYPLIVLQYLGAQRFEVFSSVTDLPAGLTRISMFSETVADSCVSCVVLSGQAGHILRPVFKGTPPVY